MPVQGLTRALAARLEEMAQSGRLKGNEAVISAAGSRVKLMVIPTNEELVVARETRRLLEKT